MSIMKQNIILIGAKGKMCQMIEHLTEFSATQRVIYRIDPEYTDHELHGYYKKSECYNPLMRFRSIEELTPHIDETKWDSTPIVVDFSHQDAIAENLDLCKKYGFPLVTGTTGFNEARWQFIEDVCDIIPILQTYNFSMGINVMRHLLNICTKVLYNSGFDIEIIEKHHNKKKDSPSGTALLLQTCIQQQLDFNMNLVMGRGDEDKSERDRHDIGIHAVRGGTIPGDHEVIFAGPNEIFSLHHQAQSREIFALGALRAVKFIQGKPRGRYDMDDVVQEFLEMTSN